MFKFVPIDDSDSEGDEEESGDNPGTEISDDSSSGDDLDDDSEENSSENPDNESGEDDSPDISITDPGRQILIDLGRPLPAHFGEGA